MKETKKHIKCPSCKLCIFASLAFFVWVLLPGVSTHGATISLTIYNKSELKESTDTTVLADGSWVMLIGSLDDVIDPMETYGSSYIANSTTGDDVLLSTFRVGDGVADPGKFSVNCTFDKALFPNTYLRFFDFANDNAFSMTDWGSVYWGTTKVVNVSAASESDLIDYVKNSQDPHITGTSNNFVVIPEPATAALFVIAGGLLVSVFLKKHS